MSSAVIHGEIKGGRVLTKQALTDFEGMPVVITLTAPDAPARMTAAGVMGVSAAEEAETFEDVGRIRLPEPVVGTVRIHLIDVGRKPMRVYSSDEED